MFILYKLWILASLKFSFVMKDKLIGIGNTRVQGLESRRKKWDGIHEDLTQSAPLGDLRRVLVMCEQDNGHIMTSNPFTISLK